MVVGQSLILGLGKLLDTAQTQSEVFNTFEHVPYVAVQISSNTETELAMSAPFLGQHHGLDIPRSQLKYILPMLSAKHMNSNNVFAEHTVSRRYARVLFAHAQETIWKHIEDSIAHSLKAWPALQAGDMDKATLLVHTTKPPRPKPARPAAPQTTD